MCLIGCLALFFPRLALALVWLFGGGYLQHAVQPWIWLLLGFLFLPLTTLTFAYANNSLAPAGDVSPLGWMLVAVAALVDLGIIGGSGKSARNRRDKDRED